MRRKRTLVEKKTNIIYISIFILKIVLAIFSFRWVYNSLVHSCQHFSRRFLTNEWVWVGVGMCVGVCGWVGGCGYGCGCGEVSILRPCSSPPTHPHPHSHPPTHTHTHTHPPTPHTHPPTPYTLTYTHPPTLTPTPTPTPTLTPTPTHPPTPTLTKSILLASSCNQNLWWWNSDRN
jgi:hypothetical protein